MNQAVNVKLRMTVDCMVFAQRIINAPSPVQMEDNVQKDFPVLMRDLALFFQEPNVKLKKIVVTMPFVKMVNVHRNAQGLVNVLQTLNVWEVFVWYLQEHNVRIARIVDRLGNVDRTSVYSNVKTLKTVLVDINVPMASALTKACHLKASVRLIQIVKEKDTVRMGLVFWNAREKQKPNVQMN